MAADLKKRFAERLRAVIDGKVVVDIPGGPSRSYVYRMLKGKANPSIEELDAVVRAYGSSLAEFFLPWLKGTSLAQLKVDPRDEEITQKFVIALRVPKLNEQLTGLVNLVLSASHGDEGNRIETPRKGAARGAR